MSSEKIVACVKAANTLFLKAQETVVYRPSVAYILQEIKSFVHAIQPFKNKNLSQSETRAVERLSGLIAHFLTVLPNLGANWIRAVLNCPSTYIHDYIDSFRKSLIEICQQLSLDPEQVIQYNQIQDAVNKIADFQHLKAALTEVRDKSISVDNAVDIQQLIEIRLRSITRHLPQRKTQESAEPLPSSEAVPVMQLRDRMEHALTQFTKIDIPDEDLIIGKSLGAGGFGTVYSATRVSTGEILAIKEVRSDRLSVSSWASLYSEVATMALLHHRYVLELVGAHVKEPYRIITRFCPGRSLFDRLHRCQNQPLSSAKLTQLAYQVASGMAFLHEKGVVHRDLKSMNILLDESDSARIADFGLCGSLRDNKDLIGMLGTPHYTAPEVLDRKRYGPKVDAYSYGIVLWEMETRHIPFREKTHKEIIEHVVVRGWRLPFPRTTPEGLRRLITRCWSANPSERPEFAEIVELFKRGEVYFGTEPLPPASLEAGTDFPPINGEHVQKILADPSHSAFPSIVDFVSRNMSPSLLKKLREARIVERYQRGMPNTNWILVAAAHLLAPEEFGHFVATVGAAMIEEILSEPKAPRVSSAIRFCLAVPREQSKLVSGYTPRFVEHLDSPGASGLVLRLLARGGEAEIAKYTKQLAAYFGQERTVDSQVTLDALAVVLPVIIGSIVEKTHFVSILESELEIPPAFASMLVGSLDDAQLPACVRAMAKAGERTNLNDPIASAAKRLTQPQLLSLARDDGFLQRVTILIRQSASTEAGLFLLFKIAGVPEVPQMIANHSVITAVLEHEEHCAMRLMIFTMLLLQREFIEDTASMDAILKFLVESLSKRELADQSLRLIGALTMCPAGCQIIGESRVLSLFSQLFLSPTINNSSIPLLILKNISSAGMQVPQISLIISCLLQDLILSPTKGRILNTLTALISVAPEAVQEQDLHNAVLPLLSPRQTAPIIVLVLRLFDACDMQKLRLFYGQVMQRISAVLHMEEFLFPELIDAAVTLVMSLATSYDIGSYVRDLRLLEFVENVISQLSESEEFAEIAQRLGTFTYLLQNLTLQTSSGSASSSHMPKKTHSEFVLSG